MSNSRQKGASVKNALDPRHERFQPFEPAIALVCTAATAATDESAAAACAARAASRCRPAAGTRPHDHSVGSHEKPTSRLVTA